MNTELSLDRIKRWRDEYRSVLAPSPLMDISQLTAQLDLTHAHPSGIAKLFASGQAALDALFRDGGMLRAAESRLNRVIDDRAAKRRVSGVAELSLAVGVATWSGKSMPVLLYPVDVIEDGKQPSASVVRFTGHVSINAAFLDTMRLAGVDIDVDHLFDASNYDNGVPDTSSVFAAISEKADRRLADFSIERHIVLGCFLDPGMQVLSESHRIIDRLADGATGITPLDALAGDERAQQRLRDDAVPEFSPFDADPHTESEVGDVSNAARYAAQLAASGHSLFVDCPGGRGSSEVAAAIASRCVMNGRSVLVVPGVADQKRRFVQLMKHHGMAGQVLDIAGDDTNASIDRQLIAAVGFQSGPATSHFDQLADELVGVRSRLTRYLGDLHGVNERWGVSAYQTIENLASISVLPTHPSTRVRLDVASARQIGGRMDEWIGKLERAGELGEYVIGPNDTAWYRATITSADDASAMYQRITDLLEKLLPAVREHVATVVQTCGFPVPNTAREWGMQITVLKNLRRVLDVFQPEIFERDIDSMIEASKSKADRKAEGSSMGFWERRRHMREAKGLLRVGAQVENLHDALIVVRKQADQWRSLVPHGGWPVLPPKLDHMVDVQDALADDLTALNAALSSTPQGGDLETVDFAQLENRLKALYDDKPALDTLPERCRLENEFHAAGLDDLIADLSTRRVDTAAVGGELQLAWWTTVFEDIVRSSEIISNQDGSALENASARFAQVDAEHVRSIGPMVAQEATRRLCDMLFSRTQEANQLHTALAGRSGLSLSRIIGDHRQILSAAKPVLVGTPATLTALTQAEPIADLAIIDACSHIAPVQLLGILARARQIVVIAHGETLTCEGLTDLIAFLPRVEVQARPASRSPRLNAFLESQGYGYIRYDVPREGARGDVRFHHVEASGVPAIASGLVESSQQEIDEVVRIITERAAGFAIVPTGYVLSVVSLTQAFRTRLGAELRAVAAKNSMMDAFLRHVRLVDIHEVAGAAATDVILSLCYAKTTHGRLLQQFGALEDPSGRGMLLDALALPERDLDIVASFGTADLDAERLHQPGPKLLKAMLAWAEGLQDGAVQSGDTQPSESESSGNVLFDDLAERIRARGLRVAVDYGFDKGMRIPLAIGLKDHPLVLAVLTDDTDFMSIQSTRERHRKLGQNLATLGWSVMNVWSVAAFVNPDKEVDRIVARLGQMYQERG